MQVLEVTIEEVYRRDIKKIQFVRFERDPANNEGVRTVHETVLVPVEHASVRFAGLGDCNTGDTVAGDAVFVMSVLRDELYELHARNDHELHATIEVSPYELCFGGRRVLPHPSGNGDTIVLEIGPRFFERLERIVTVPRHGLFDAQLGIRKDLHLSFRVCTELDSRQMRALRMAFCTAPAVRPEDEGDPSAHLHI